jgi:dihydroorotase
MADILIKNALIVNEGSMTYSDVLIRNERIERIDASFSVGFRVQEIHAEGQLLLPGCIDDQVHFREPGLTHKANIESESRAAVAGGVTSFMEMPNTRPSAVTQELLEQKYALGKETSAANYSFFMGTTNTNIDEVKKTNPRTVCGVKIFMGSSTGDMLVNDPDALEAIFANSPTLVATHCEDDVMIQENLKEAIARYGENIPAWDHPNIRSVEACYASSKLAIDLASKHGTQLHILHISTAKELELFSSEVLKNKKITSEACVHHLWFSADDYDRLGYQIKCNPAIKEAENREAIWKAIHEGKIDVIATDHAPHTWDEKTGSYKNSHAGLPLVQHSLQMMLDKHEEGYISIPKIVDMMAHRVAELFRVEDRGYIREGYYADLVLVKKESYQVKRENILYKCGWSPLMGYAFAYSVAKTFVNGSIAFENGVVQNKKSGQRLLFTR